MDDLLREFLTETGEHLDVVDVELVRFEREPGTRRSCATSSGSSTPSRAPAAFSACRGWKRWPMPARP
jgi:hypothetical protein